LQEEARAELKSGLLRSPPLPDISVGGIDGQESDCKIQAEGRRESGDGRAEQGRHGRAEEERGIRQRSKAARVAHSPKSTASKTAAKPARKSIVGKAVGAVSATVSSVAGQATSLFKRGRAEKTR
jgi:hypothetical protein